MVNAVSGNTPPPPRQQLRFRATFVFVLQQLAQTETTRLTYCTNTEFTNQGVDERVFVPELCLKEPILFAELLHLLSE